MVEPTLSPEDNGESWYRPPSETEPADALGMLVSDFSHDPEALAANLIGVLGRAANLAPLSYKIGDTDCVLGEPAQALAMRVLRGAQDPRSMPVDGGREGFEVVSTFLQDSLGRRKSAEHFPTHLETILQLKARATAGLTLLERRMLVLFDVRLRHAAGRFFRGYCEDFDIKPPPHNYVHPLLYEEYFLDASLDSLEADNPG